MRVELIGHQVDVSPGLRALLDRKLAKLTRMMNDHGVSASVVVSQERVQKVVELTLHARGEHFLHAVAKGETWQTAATGVVAKVLHQAEKVKNVWQDRKRRGPQARSVKTPRRVRSRAAAEATPATGKVAPARRRPRTQP